MKGAAILLNEILLRLGASPAAVAEMRDGTRVRVDLRARTDRVAFYTGRYEAEWLDVLLSLLDPTAAFLDVGANIGFYTVAIANHIRRSGGSGHLFGFEPFEPNFRRNQENIGLNGLGAVCTLVPVGLSSANRAEVLTLREDFAAGAATGNAAVATNARFDAGFGTATIQLRRLDDLWPELGSALPVDLVKVDIEGHEDHFLEGAKETLARHRPTILMEVNKPYYRARGIDVEPRFPPLIPPRYAVLRRSRGRWVHTDSLAACAELENVLLVPLERLLLPRYAGLAAAAQLRPTP